MDTLPVVGLTLAGVAAMGLTAAIVSFSRKLAIVRRRATFIEQYAFPLELRESLQRDGGFSLAQSDRVLEALKQYFLVWLLAQRSGIGKELGMPSKAVDAAWHQFTLMPREYETFCLDAFGDYLPRTTIRPEESDKPLANTLHQLKKRAPVRAGWAMVGAMPLIFALDRELGVKDGHIYDDAAFKVLEGQRRHFELLASGLIEEERRDTTGESGSL